MFYDIQGFTLIDLLLKLAGPGHIFQYLNKKLSKINSLCHSILIISILSIACHMQKHQYLHIFYRYSNLIADLLMLVYLIIDACMAFKNEQYSEDIAH